MPHDASVTELLAALNAGDRQALDDLVPHLYGELKRIAHRQLAGERPDHTLNTTAVVHEAYLELAALDRIRWSNRAHFFAIAARLMRRILLEYAVRRRAQKRGGGAERVPLDEVDLPAEAADDRILELEEALARLEALEARQARVVECRFFGGLSVEETAQVLRISPATVKRDWNTARAWLNRELSV